MATLFIRAWTDAKEVALGPVEQSINMTITGASTQSAVLTQNSTLARKRVRLMADAVCYVAWGTNPTADSTSVPLGVENPEYFDVPVGDKFAVITRT